MSESQYPPNDSVPCISASTYAATPEFSTFIAQAYVHLQLFIQQEDCTIEDIDILEHELTNNLTFTSNSILDKVKYTEYNEKIIRVMEKKVHFHKTSYLMNLKNKDIDSLKPNVWLTDSIIDAYLLHWGILFMFPPTNIDQNCYLLK
jgi:hypothetical protein